MNSAAAWRYEDFQASVAERPGDLKRCPRLQSKPSHPKPSISRVPSGGHRGSCRQREEDAEVRMWPLNQAVTAPHSWALLQGPRQTILSSPDSVSLNMSGRMSETTQSSHGTNWMDEEQAAGSRWAPGASLIDPGRQVRPENTLSVGLPSAQTRHPDERRCMVRHNFALAETAKAGLHACSAWDSNTQLPSTIAVTRGPSTSKQDWRRVPEKLRRHRGEHPLEAPCRVHPCPDTASSKTANSSSRNCHASRMPRALQLGPGAPARTSHRLCTGH